MPATVKHLCQRPDISRSQTRTIAPGMVRNNSARHQLGFGNNPNETLQPFEAAVPGTKNFSTTNLNADGTAKKIKAVHDQLPDIHTGSLSQLSVAHAERLPSEQPADRMREQNRKRRRSATMTEISSFRRILPRDMWRNRVAGLSHCPFFFPLTGARLECEQP